MYIVNTSFMVDPAVHAMWFEMLTTKYIPFLKENGFSSIVFTRVISNDTPDHFTYSLQINISDMAQYKQITEELFPEYQTIAEPVFGSKVLWITTLMKIIEY